MVAAVHGGIGRIAVPQFPYGGGSVVYHVSVAREGVLAYNLHSQVGVPTACERSHEMLYSQHSTTHMAVKLPLCHVDDIAQHPLLIAFGHQPQFK